MSSPIPMNDISQSGGKGRWYTVIMLALIYTSSQVDRQIMGILLEPIRLELGASDTAMGFLVGLTFALFYATLGMPIAMIADRSNRRNIIAIAIAIWSAMTVVCGLTVNFWQMALARIGVAVGESGSTPPSFSIIADLFAPYERATAMSVFSAGASLGLFIALMGGGLMVDSWGWRVAFFVVGAPGLLLAVLFFFTVREPERVTHEGEAKTTSGEAPKFFQTFVYMVKSPALRHIVAGKSLGGFISYGFALWLPAFLIRSHGLSSTQIGISLAILIGVFGVIGTLLTGRLVDYVGRWGDHWRTWTIAIAKLLIIPFSLLFLLLGNVYWALAAYVIPAMLMPIYIATSAALIQQLVQVRMRALAAAITLFLVNLVGLGLGPLGVGNLSDLLVGQFGDDSLRYALAFFTLVNVWCAFHYWLAGRALKKQSVEG